MKATLTPVSRRTALTALAAVGTSFALSGCATIRSFVDAWHGQAPQPDLPADLDDTPLDTSEADIPLDYYLVGGFDLSRIAAAKDVRQICIVSGTGGYDAHVVFAERREDGWTALVDTTGHIGGNGIAVDIDEWSGKTPEGVFGLGFAFGIKDDPGTRMEYRKVTKDIYWVADPDSPYYNQWVDITETGKVWKDGSQTEHLIDYTKPYAYCIVIQYNMPPTGYARSSAIFLHCIGHYFTGGCVSIPEADMVTILKAIDPEGAVIVIANGDDIYRY